MAASRPFHHREHGARPTVKRLYAWMAGIAHGSSFVTPVQEGGIAESQHLLVVQE